MNQADILKLAEEACVDYGDSIDGTVHRFIIEDSALIKMMELVAQHEREQHHMEELIIRAAFQSFELTQDHEDYSKDHWSNWAYEYLEEAKARNKS